MNGLQVDVLCEKCKNKILLNASTVKVEQFKANDGKIFNITYYECQKCGKIHYVQIDNDNTKRMLEYSKVALKQAMVYRSKNQTPPKKIKTKLDKARKKLSNTRLELMKQYNETVFEDLQSKEEVKICFSL